MASTEELLQTMFDVEENGFERKETKRLNPKGTNHTIILNEDLSLCLHEGQNSFLYIKRKLPSKNSSMRYDQKETTLEGPTFTLCKLINTEENIIDFDLSYWGKGILRSKDLKITKNDPEGHCSGTYEHIDLLKLQLSEHIQNETILKYFSENPFLKKTSD